MVLLLIASPVALADETPDISFDRDIGPLLARRCLGCHNASAKKGELDLSQAATARSGGESGPAIEPGKLDASLLWQRVSDDDMPPKKPLLREEKDLLRRWILAGAVWGRGAIDPFRFSTDQRAGYDWWSLQPIKQPDVPHVRDATNWARNDVDRFILAKLEAERLAPAQQADPRTLIRRLYLDLVGLPPAPEEMETWTLRLASSASDDTGYRALVEHLLDSPHYGERWARHWLDVIRFGESQGFERNRIRENAWRYRDWVIQAFNRDLPYDEFIRQQIAGDVLYPGDLDALLATGFLVCGTWDQVGHREGSAEMQKAVRLDHLEDMVAALGQSMLGLTANCARCHDHKFDPISQQEYYQFAALIGGVTQDEKERQGIALRSTDERTIAWTSSRDRVRRQLLELEKDVRDKYEKQDAGKPIDGLQALYRPAGTGQAILEDQSGVGEPLNLAAHEKRFFASAGPATKLVEASKASQQFTVEAWLTPAVASQTGPARIVTLSLDTGQRNFTLGQDGSRFDLRFRTTKTDQNGLPSLASPDGLVTTHRTHVVYTFEQDGDLRCYVNGKQVARRHVGGELANWNAGYRLALGDELTGDRGWAGQLHFVAIYGKALSAAQVQRNFETQSRDVTSSETLDALLVRASSEERNEYEQLRRELQRLEENPPAEPFGGVAHVVIPKQPAVFHVLARGDYRNPRDMVAPRGLRALSLGGLSDDFGLKPDAPEAERRAALARWISDPHNPLTPRVLVNRLWHFHFGRGIVDTPSDFGFSGGRPSHPELLDWLAAKFVEDGWSVKAIHRLIVLSATYRQDSNVNNQAASRVDEDNRLCWRGNARRMDGESTRDAMLVVSGALNPRVGGPSFRDVQVKLGTNHEFTDPTGEFNDEVNRRTIYRLWARCGNNPLLESLDCPDPSVMSPQRSQTITPVQSLALLNSAFVEHCGARLAERARREGGGEVARQIERTYVLTLGRPPQPRELALARRLVESQGLEQLCIVLFNTNEFLFVE